MKSGNQAWTEIVARIERLRKEESLAPIARALAAIENVASLVANAPFNHGLFGWTSMFDLCIQQTDISPGSGPYLRISPQQSGHVEFRYIDTMISDRQWSREVPPERVKEQFSKFLSQLHWISE